MHRKRTKHLAWLTAIALAGCSPQSSDPKFDVVPVRGTVLLNGQPLADAQVSFWFQGSPPEGYPGSGAKTDAQGKYTLSTLGQPGTLAGKHKVVVNKMTMKDGSPLAVNEGMDEEQLRMQGEVVDSIAPPFNNPATTPVEIDVTAQKSDGYDIEIKK